MTRLTLMRAKKLVHGIEQEKAKEEINQRLDGFVRNNVYRVSTVNTVSTVDELQQEVDRLSKEIIRLRAKLDRIKRQE